MAGNEVRKTKYEIMVDTMKALGVSSFDVKKIEKQNHKSADVGNENAGAGVHVLGVVGFVIHSRENTTRRHAARDGRKRGEAVPGRLRGRRGGGDDRRARLRDDILRLDGQRRSLQRMDHRHRAQRGPRQG